MLTLTAIHHVAIICSNYEVSKRFYTEVLGLSIVAEHYREERKSWKLDLSLDGKYVIELFSFQDPPERVSRPEACGLRHLAFQVHDLKEAINLLTTHGIEAEPIRVDEYTGKRFTFFSDPDNLPLEFYEQ
jgi:glyoxylase I family protein